MASILPPLCNNKLTQKINKSWARKNSKGLFIYPKNKVENKSPFLQGRQLWRNLEEIFWHFIFLRKNSITSVFVSGALQAVPLLLWNANHQNCRRVCGHREVFCGWRRWAFGRPSLRCDCSLHHSLYQKYLGDWTSFRLPLQLLILSHRRNVPSLWHCGVSKMEAGWLPEFSIDQNKP